MFTPYAMQLSSTFYAVTLKGFAYFDQYKLIDLTSLVGPAGFLEFSIQSNIEPFSQIKVVISICFPAKSFNWHRVIMFTNCASHRCSCKAASFKQTKAFPSLLKTESAALTQPCNGCLCTLFNFPSAPNQWMSTSCFLASKWKRDFLVLQCWVSIPLTFENASC